MAIATTLGDIRKKMENARVNAPLAAPRTLLLGASKGQSAPVLEEAIKSGLVLFGENRVQEAADKWPGLKKCHPGVKLHLIGPLQTNKVKEALHLFDVIETLDRPKLAEEIAKVAGGRWQVAGNKNSCHLSPVTRNFYIQVNTGAEPQKAGVLPDDADAFIAYCKKLGLPVTGLMSIPPPEQPAAPHFALLREIAQRNGLCELSMGMSEDFETAIRMGSTCVRIGRALFGER